MKLIPECNIISGKTIKQQINDMLPIEFNNKDLISIDNFYYVIYMGNH